MSTTILEIVLGVVVLLFITSIARPKFPAHTQIKACNKFVLCCEMQAVLVDVEKMLIPWVK